MRERSGMNAGALCTHRVATIYPYESVVTAARRMREEHVGSLVVVADEGEQRVPLGILTDRDIVVGVLAVEPTHLATLEVGDLLAETKEPYSVRESDDLLDILERMETHALRRVVVINERGALVGVVALDDVIRVLRGALDRVANIVTSQQAREWQRRP